MRKGLLFYYPISFLYWIRSFFVQDKRLQVYTSLETVDLLLAKEMSCSRFGDGELRIIKGGGIGFQRYDEKLANRLKEVLCSNRENHLVCIPYYLKDMSNLNRESKTFWRYSLLRNRKYWDSYLSEDRRYGDTQFTRFYMNLKNKEQASALISQIKGLCSERDIVIVEGVESRLGVGNDLFQGVSSIRRIICPAENAFAYYDLILGKCLQYPENSLFIIALGPTATVLAYDLSLSGYQALDVGHIDIEYEWYLRHSTTKIPIDGKYVNECHVRGGSIDDEVYQSQIDAVISESGS